MTHINGLTLVPFNKLNRWNLLHLFLGMNIGYFGWKLFTEYKTFCPFVIWFKNKK